MPTLGDFRSAVAGKLGLNNTASSTEQGYMDDWANEAVLEILLRTHCNVSCAEMATTAAVWKYDLSTSPLAIRDVWREDSNGNFDPVYRVSEEELLELHRSSGASNAAFTRYALIGSNLFAIWPTPSAAYDFHLFYVPRPTAMSDAAHDPSNATYGRIPAEYHKAIEYYMLWQGAEFDENRPAQGGERYRSLFENYISTVIRPAIKRRGGMQMPRARVRTRRPALLRENDRY